LSDEALSAAVKLGELRAVEAVGTLTKTLLLQQETASNDENEMGEKYESIKEYPVAVALARIGIPSIWGLLDEIADSDHDDGYRKVAYETMTTILPAVAIPGFVKVATKPKDDRARTRLYKMYQLAGLPIPDMPMPD
jgi:hypothetical protein